VAPPCFDAPETIALFDHKTRYLFSADCFGALTEQPVETLNDIPVDALRDGCITWATVDAPWLHRVEPGLFQTSLNAIQLLNPEVILSAHLPPAEHMTQRLLGYLAEAHRAPVFVGPDQQALERMLVA